MPTPKRSISSRVAKQNPRPRKYATAAERQKALRERFPTLCVRVEQEQADFMKRIADEQGRTLQDVHLAFIKYANGRGNQWLTQGLKGFAPLPRFEETPKENPMKRKPTPAQIAARERFAAMARSGAFKKKAAKARKKNPRASNPIILVSDKAIATKRKANPVKRRVMKEKRPFYYVVKVGQSYDGQFLSTHYSLDDVKKIAQQKADKYGAQAKITELHM